MKPRLIVYIDGYNWHHAVFKHHPEWKWLNLSSFFRELRPHEEVIAVKMFSAIMVPTLQDPDAPERQQRYFKALRALSNVKVILGSFQPRDVQCRVCRSNYTIQEEKKTDVNIAVELLNDAFNREADAICVVSGDSDVQPAVEWIANNRPETAISLYIPALPKDRPNRRLDYFSTRGYKRITCTFLPLESIPRHQLHPSIKLEDGTFAIRPHTWAPPSAGLKT